MRICAHMPLHLDDFAFIGHLPSLCCNMSDYDLTNYGDWRDDGHGCLGIALGEGLKNIDDVWRLVRIVEGLLSGLSEMQFSCLALDEAEVHKKNAREVVAAGIRLYLFVKGKPKVDYTRTFYPRYVVARVCVMLALKYMVVYQKNDSNNLVQRLKPFDVTPEQWYTVESAVLQSIDNYIIPFCEDPNDVADANILQRTSYTKKSVELVRRFDAEAEDVLQCVVGIEAGNVVVDQYGNSMNGAVLVSGWHEQAPGDRSLFYANRKSLPSKYA